MPILPPRIEKENYMLSTSNENASNAAAHQPRNRVPRDHFAEKQDEKNSSVATSSPYELRRNANTKTEDVMDTSKTTMKVPVDPPGAIHPMMHHYSNGHQQHPQQHHANIYGPIYPSMNNSWAYNPNHSHQQQHHNHQQPYPQQHQQWTMPHFLAPLAAFMAGDGNHGRNNAPFGNMVHNDSGGNNVQQYHNSYDTNMNHNSNNNDAAMYSDDEDDMSTEESMTSADGGGDTPAPTTNTSSDTKVVESKFVPSTFAPPEVVEKIRAKREAAAKAIQPRQTRSMAAKKNRDQRGATSSTSSSSSSSKSKTKSSNVTAAFQACSPPSNIIHRGKIGNGSKVAALLTAASEMESSPPAPKVMTVLGKRVTMIDESRKIVS